MARIAWTARRLGDGAWEGTIEIPIPSITVSGEAGAPALLRDLQVRAMGLTPGDALVGALCHADTLCGALEQHSGFFDFSRLIPQIINRGARLATTIADMARTPGVRPEAAVLRVVSDLATPPEQDGGESKHRATKILGEMMGEDLGGYGDVLSGEELAGLTALGSTLARPGMFDSSNSGAPRKNPIAQRLRTQRRKEIAKRLRRVVQRRAQHARAWDAWSQSQPEEPSDWSPDWSPDEQQDPYQQDPYSPPYQHE